MAGHQFPRAVVDRAAQYLIRFVLAGGLLYGINRWWILPSVEPESFYRTTFNDVLALIVFVPLSYILARKLPVISPVTPLRFGHIALGWLVFSVVFEWLVPNVLPHHTGSWGDIAAYAAGGVLLWLFYIMAVDLARIQTATIQVIYYDGNCGICQLAADWSDKRTISDRPFPYRPHQMLDEKTDPVLFRRARKTLIVRFNDGIELTHARGLGALLLRMKHPWPLFGWILVSPIFWLLTRPAYSVFARYRHKVSQWLGLNACVIQ